MTDGIVIEGTVGHLIMRGAHLRDFERGVYVAAGASVQGIYADGAVITGRKRLPIEAAADLKRRLGLDQSVPDALAVKELNLFWQLVPEQKPSFAQRLRKSVGLAADLAADADRLFDIVDGRLKHWSA